MAHNTQMSISKMYNSITGKHLRRVSNKAKVPLWKLSLDNFQLRGLLPHLSSNAFL